MIGRHAWNSTLRPASFKKKRKAPKPRAALRHGTKRLARRTPLRPVNPERKTAAFLRAYGEVHHHFVRGHPCVVLADAEPAKRTRCRGPVEAAHAVGRGMGGARGDKRDLFPACRRHHNEQDGREPCPNGGVGREAFVESYGVDPIEVAARLWAASPENPERTEP